NPDKMLWLNQQHMIRAQPKDLVPHLRWHLARLGVFTQEDALLEGIILAQRERSKTLKEMAENSRLFFGDDVILDPRAAEKHLTADAKAMLRELRTRFAAIEDWVAPGIHAALEGLATEKSLSLGKVAQPLRVAVTGGTISPPIDATLALLGQPRTLARIDKALS
ncbi:MAG: glutamate--tRNA ligase, partial [Steroidobacteraceae bacterium]|nr:glutamate--tRNA ligase [Steroidobacteraceae bacterium]